LKGLILDDTLMIFIATWELYEVNDNLWHLKCCVVAFARGEKLRTIGVTLIYFLSSSSMKKRYLHKFKIPLT
jgi:hypothetical protein